MTLRRGSPWDQFFVEHAPRSDAPAVWRRPCLEPLLTAKEALAVLASACEQGLAGRDAKADFRIRFFRNGVQSELSPRLIPRSADTSPQGYARRVEASTPDSVGLLLNNYHCLDAQLWHRLRGFFRAWFEHTGMPAGGATADLFLANYPTTPFGVHRDGQDIYTWIVSGRKRFLLWPLEVFDGMNMQDVALDDHRDRATVLEGEAGDLMFWPTSYWHIAESVGDPVVTLSLGRFMDSVEEVVVEEAERVLDDVIARAELPRGPAAFVVDRHEVQTLPEPLRDAADRVGDHMMDTLHRRWLARASNAGLPPPPARTTPLPAATRLAADPSHPILWAESNGGILVAGAGRTLWSSEAPWLPALIEALNRGDAATADEFLDELHDDAWPRPWRARAMETIAALYSFRALLAVG